MKTPKTKRLLIVYGAALLLLIYGLVQLAQQYVTTHRKALPSPQTVVTYSANQPGEAPIDTHANTYNVAPDIPKLIAMPSLPIDGFIQQVGVDPATNTIAAPTNVHLAGWYTKSVKPGDDGVSIIDGHVQGYYTPGIFRNLSNLKLHDKFYVQYGDGSRRNFEVVSTTSYPHGAAADHMFEHDPAINQQLNLITCDGAYDKESHTYNNRLLVVAKRI